MEATAAPLDAELALEAVTSSEATLELKLQAIEADKQMIILLVEMERKAGSAYLEESCKKEAVLAVAGRGCAALKAALIQAVDDLTGMKSELKNTLESEFTSLGDHLM